METSTDNSIRNGLIVTIAGGLVVYIILRLAPEVWVWLKNIFIIFYNHLIADTAIKNWFFYFLVFISVLTLIQWVIQFTGVILKKRVAHLNYTKDTFLECDWHWSYSTDAGIKDIYARCPECFTLLTFKEQFNSGAQLYTHLICDCCNKHKLVEPDDKKSLINKISRMIERKIHTGSWKNINQYKA